MMKIMGIDVGTTSISMIYMDGDSGNLVARETINHKSFLSGGFSDEKMQDPERIWSIVRKSGSHWSYRSNAWNVVCGY